MANFHDPVQVRQDFGAYASTTWLPITYFAHPLTVTMKNIQAIVCGLFLWVDIRQRLALPLDITPLIPPLRSDGSSSFLSITSGISSEGASPTDGRFGFIPPRVSPRS